MNTDQLAAEAWRKIVSPRNVEMLPESQAISIIKSAIEKARPMVTLKPHIRSVTDVVESAENVTFSISGGAQASEK